MTDNSKKAKKEKLTPLLSYESEVERDWDTSEFSVWLMKKLETTVGRDLLFFQTSPGSSKGLSSCREIFY